MKFTNKLSRELQDIDRILDKILLFRRFEFQHPESSNESLINFIQSLKTMTVNILKQMDKDVHFKADIKVNTFPYLDQLKNSIIHLIKNSINHDIENEFERLERNKKKEGLVKLIIYKDDKNYFVEVVDVGNSINFN